ncbi:unnamed protein product [Fraxinus pennsylvanica]|uniref:Phytocyanin domain-containing protein n=1 Tax=Fraxinus pennsylvanica TaxID=56036 RepID=A0AAD2AAX8_9LAMI|nr:unnamed protein product [Fraxinus pennsylvanica]
MSKERAAGGAVNLLWNAEATGSDEYPVEIRLITAPKYVLYAQTVDKVSAPEDNLSTEEMSHLNLGNEEPYPCLALAWPTSISVQIGMETGITLQAAISMFSIGMANKNFSADWNGNWNHTAGWPYGHWNADQTSKRIIVGGSENWHFGFNYTDWAIRNGPFYLNDTLVFKFDPPNNTTFPHSVYLLPNFWSFQNCDLRRAQKIAQVTQGGGEEGSRGAEMIRSVEWHGLSGQSYVGQRVQVDLD